MLNRQLSIVMFTVAMIMVIPWVVEGVGQAQEPNVCQTLADSIYSYEKISRKGNTNEDVYEYFQTEAFYEDLRNNKFGAGLSIPIDGVPVQFNANMDKASFKKEQAKLTRITKRRFSDSQMIDIFSAVPDHVIAQYAVECASNNTGGLFLAITSDDGQRVNIKGTFKKRCECEDNPKVTKVFISYEPNQQQKVPEKIDLGLKLGDKMKGEKNDFTFSVLRPPDGKELVLTVDLESKQATYSKTVRAPKVPQPDSLLQSIKNGTVFRLDLRNDYGTSSLVAGTPYEIQFLKPDKWIVHGKHFDSSAKKYITRVCTHKEFEDHLGVRPVNVENYEFGIWGGIMKYRAVGSTFGTSDGGPINLKVDEKGRPLPMESIKNAEPHGECTHEK